MKLLVDGLDIPRWVIVVFLACWAPALCFLLLALSPFYVALLFTCFIINVIRAARFTPIRTWRLIKAISAHVGYVICHLPRLASIAGYYYLCSPRDGVRKDVPYALRRNPTKDSTASAILKDGAAALGIPSGEVRYLLADVYFHTAAAARVAQPTQHGTATDDEVSSPTAATTSSSSSSCDVTGTSNKPRSSLAPVIVFVYGGAWGSGQRWYYSHFAAALRAVTGSVVVVPEYSTYPEGDMTAMVSDIHNAVLWTQSNVGRFGGDAKNISLIGHSAGAHLIALYLVRHAMHIAKIEPAVLDDSHTELGSREPLPLFNLWPTFHHRYPPPASADLSTTFLERSAEQHQRARLGRQPTNAFHRVILLSGVYDLIAHFEFETGRGVEEVSPMRPATAGKWAELSPTHLLKSLPSTQRDAVLSRLPAMSILHAETDTTVDVSQSHDFAQACARASSSDIVHHVDHASIVMDVRYRWAQTSAADHPTLRAVQSLIGGTL